MKIFIFLILLAVTTSFGEWLDQDAGGIAEELLKKDTKPAVTDAAANVAGLLRKIAQGDVSPNVADEKDSVLQALKSLSISAEPDEGTEEYFIMLIVKAIAIGLGTGVFSAGVKHLVERNQAKRDG
ncbi:uncharacterized protein LOC119441075 [Dermacentor silvarum]|uniref:uncharacterized protein LOC119441075 n=1 Tax=Dermacentor silvarum TaxID=543639 RepID=UPI002101807C|nr:uncharacterized protein LOC119441075 [Dermacentor silvarum]